MTDWARDLPLSNRDRSGDAAAARDRSAPTAALLEQVAAVLDARPALLAAPTRRPEVTTAAAVREALSALDARWWTRWARALGAAEPVSPAVAATPDEALSSALRARAVALAAPERRAGIRALGAALVLALDVRAAHALVLDIDPMLCGAVALDLALRSRNPERALLTARTLVAVDGGWQVGSGPRLPSTAAAIVLFLARRAGLPPEVDEPLPSPPPGA
jgi:hypothetical protein